MRSERHWPAFMAFHRFLQFINGYICHCLLQYFSGQLQSLDEGQSPAYGLGILSSCRSWLMPKLDLYLWILSWCILRKPACQHTLMCNKVPLQCATQCTTSHVHVLPMILVETASLDCYNTYLSLNAVNLFLRPHTHWRFYSYVFELFFILCYSMASYVNAFKL